ncbi:MAG: dihydrofolate reductase [Candidatus Heimdallarchaeota archaeon]|nr:dihydrofolate reductase [Candidatus Heimdallarchaeota archaeon]
MIQRDVVLLMGMGINGISVGGWIPPAETKAQAEEMIEDVWFLLENIDTLIIGRKTFQLWAEYWPSRAEDPTSSDFQKRFSLYVNQINKIVFSKTLKEVQWENSLVLNGEISTEISRLKKISGKQIAVVGGSGIAHSCINNNIIDEFQLYIHPVLYASGNPVFGELVEDQRLSLIEMKKFQSGGMRIKLKKSNP